MEVREVEIKRILNPTSIDLGDYVINPYKGCAFSCLYCYVRFNKLTQRETRAWGSYVDVRVNAPELLEKELGKKKPQRLLLGSTTECLQPLETKYRLTARILEVLNKHRVKYSILTRSPLLLEYEDLLKQGYCENIYFTINDYPDNLKDLLEPKSPTFQSRIDAALALAQKRLPLIPYLSPLLPGISNIEGVFLKLKETPRIEFEGLNFNLGNIHEVIKAISKTHPWLETLYQEMRTSIKKYNQVWQEVKKEISALAQRNNKAYDIYIHGLYSYFQNRYR